MAVAEITIRLRWEWEESDGMKCSHCGDIAWLNQFRLISIIGQRENIENFILCQSCGDGMDA